MTSHEPLPPPPWRRTKRAKRQLSVDRIVTKALEILAADGLDAVTMRRVAEALGTGPASLYAHVRGKEELHELMLDAVMRKVPFPEPDPVGWQEQLKQMGRDVTRVMLDHPGVARIAMECLIPTSPHLLLQMDAMLGLLRAAGIPDRVAVLAGDTLALYCTAIAYEAGLWSGLAAGESEAARRVAEIEAYLDSLPPERLPHLMAVRPLLAEGGGDEHFEFGLDLLVSGLAAYAEPRVSE